MPLIYCVEDDENIRELVGYACAARILKSRLLPTARNFGRP